VLLAVGLLLVVMASDAMVQRLRLPVLRVLEGYWPAWLDGPRGWLVRRSSNRHERLRERLQQLHGQGVDRLSSQELAEFLRLDGQRHRRPSRPNQAMPTRLGNILRAAESRPGARYGLDAIVCWPRLWLVLPEVAKQEVTQARAVLDMAAQLWIWAALFLVWGIWAWWAILVGLLGMTVAYRQMRSAASIYGDLVESCFDLYRRQLYETLGRSIPADPAEERRSGRNLTKQLWRGPSLQPSPPRGQLPTGRQGRNPDAGDGPLSAPKATGQPPMARPGRSDPAP
jgi:hypothetical protein